MVKVKNPVLARAIESVERNHGKYVRETVGPVLYEALLKAQILSIFAMQDESINPAAIVATTREAYTALVDFFNTD